MNIETLRALLNNDQLEPFIRHIRFPEYKNFAPFTQINFTFPITALVGANGTNKSSLLRALYGSPGYNNLGNFWFSTATDVIGEGQNFPNCFIYAYKHSISKENVEVLKTRVHQKENMDYWEPSRPILRYGMARMPRYDPNDPNRTKTRWNPVSKHVELVDFRHALSAFDQYFYYGNFKRTRTLRTKQDFIRNRAPHLQEAIENELTSYTFYRRNRIEGENRTLTADELAAVCAILGRNYSEIRIVEHSFFNQSGYTAQLRQSGLRYTEAFAGSGEFAVIRLVTAISSAPERSLILLDEPEVSLHPGAQEKLLSYISKQVIEKKHQVIFTTHSPTLIRRLPSDAIKVLASDPITSEVFLTSQESLAEEAFIKIGEPIAGRKIILVEDRLAAEIVKKALRDHAPARLDLIEARYFPGGASAIFTRYIPPYASEHRTDVLCLLDGDHAPSQPWPDADQIRSLGDSDLAIKIKDQTGSTVDFQLNSGTRDEKNKQRAQLQRQYLGWCGNFVRYLPGHLCPEAFVLQKNGERFEYDPKARFAALARADLGLLSHEKLTGDDIFGTQRRLLSRIDANDKDMKEIAEIIDLFFQRATA